MTSQKSRWRRPGAALLSAALGVTLGAAVIAMPVQAADPGCVNNGAYVLFGRGSGAPFESEQARAFRSRVGEALGAAGIATAWAELGNIDGSVQPAAGRFPDDLQREYPAVAAPWAVAMPPYFYSSVDKGTNELIAHLNERYSRAACQNETLVLGGFSQGAKAVRNALAREGYGSLNQNARNHIGYVALYGDPNFNPGSLSMRQQWQRPWWARGDDTGFRYRGGVSGETVLSNAGILGASVPYVSDELSGRFGSWCAYRDGICTGSFADGTGEGTHGGAYQNHWIGESASEIAQAAIAKRSQLNPSAPLPTAGIFHGTPPDGSVVENYNGGGHKYVAVGGSLVHIPSTENIWDYVGQMQARYPSGPFHDILRMDNNEIHNMEYGFGGDRVHVPADNSFFYERTSPQQFVIQYRYAFPVGTAQEVDYLGGRDRAIMVPPGIAARLTGTPDIPNDVVLKTVTNANYYHVVHGTAYWANNYTVLDCILTVKHGGIQPVPDSLLGRIDQAGKLRTNEVTHCSFPTEWALYGPGGAERWRIDGTNPYTRHHYGSPLALHCRLGSNPTQVQLPHVAGINQPVEGESLGCPNNSFVRIIGNGEVFRVDNGILHYVPSPATLTCLTWGNNGVVINIDGAVVATTPRGNWASCQFEGRMLQAPGGRIDLVQNGSRRHVQNWNIVHCLKGRAGTGDPVVVDNATFGSYPDSGVSAYCPYETEQGLNFVQEAGDPTVWLVGPGTGGGPGIKRHVGSLCVPDPYTTQLKEYHVWTVPAGETGGHVQGADWWTDGPKCQALPKG